MIRLTTISCIKNQSEIYCIIPSLLLKVKRLKYYASIVNFVHYKISQRQGNSQLFLIGIFIHLSQDELSLYSLNDISNKVKKIFEIFLSMGRSY